MMHVRTLKRPFSMMKPALFRGGSLPTDKIRGLRWAAVLCGLMCACSALAQDAVEAVLYDASMEPTPIVLIELDSETQRVVYLDAVGARHEAGFADVLRLTFRTEHDTAAARGPAMGLTDGQVIVGHAGQGLVGVAGQTDVLRWRDADGMRAVEVTLDQLSWMTFTAGMPPPTRPPADDVLVLFSGERLTGFVDAVQVAGVGFVIGDAAAPVVIEPGRVAALHIANPFVADPGPAVLLTTVSGSRWRGAMGRSDGAAVFSTPLTQPASGAEGLPVWQPVRLGDADHRGEGWPVVARLDLPSPGRRLVALRALPMVVVEGGAFFGVPATPEQRADGSLALHAPVTVAYDLPVSASRLVATVALELPDDIPTERHAWAGCEVVVSAGGAELARVALDAGHDEHRLNVALPASDDGSTLTVTVEEGVNGPVLDRVVLRDAEVLVVTD